MKLYAVTFVAVVVLGAAPAAHPNGSGTGACQTRLLADPFQSDIERCIFALKHSVKDPAARDFADQLLESIFSGSKSSNVAPGEPLGFVDLAELIALRAQDSQIDSFLSYAASHPDDEDLRSGLARLYELRAPLVLDRMTKRSESDREQVAFLIAWGVTNNFHLFIDRENYARLAVGANWEVLDANYPLRRVARRIEEEISRLLPDGAVGEE